MIFRQTAFLVFLISGPVGFTGCVPDSSVKSSYVEWDSGGILIVESRFPAWSESKGWTLSDNPRLRIGDREGDPRYELYRAWDATRLSDGRIVIANVGTEELRYYSANGEHLETVGGSGEGPGEFRSLRSLARLPGDSVLAFDGSLRRLSVFDPDGEFVRSAQLQVPPEGTWTPFLLDALGDGTLLVRLAHSYQAGVDQSGPQNRPFSFVLYRSTGDVAASLGEFPGVEVFVQSTEGSVSVSSIPFGRTTLGRASGDRVFLGTSDQRAISVYSSDGELRTVVREDAPLMAVRESDIQGFILPRVSDLQDPQARRDAEARYRSMPIPETLPAYTDLQASNDGYLWVRRYGTGPPESPSVWDVFDPMGVLLGGVEMPASFTPREIGTDYVLGTWVAESGVEHVLLYPLEFN